MTTMTPKFYENRVNDINPNTILNYTTTTLYILFYAWMVGIFIHTYYIAPYKYRNEYKEAVIDIRDSFSRKSHEEDPDEYEDMDPGHWVFWSGREDDPQFQAVNCESCGEYVISHVANAPKCNCKNNINNYFGNDNIDISSWKTVNSDT